MIMVKENEPAKPSTKSQVEAGEDFDDRAWDFQPAMRHITLQSMQPTEEAEQ